MGESQFNKPMKFNEWWAIRSQALQDLRLTPEEWYRLFAGTNIDTGGTPQLMLNTSGQVTEASASTILTQTQQLAYTTQIMNPTFGSAASLTTDLIVKRMHRIACVTMVTDGSGNCAATTIVPALADYTGHALIYGLTSTGADAAGTYTWAVAAGTILGPSVFTMQVAANQFTFFSAAVPNVSGIGLPIRGTIAADDNKAITLAIANGAATATHWVYVEYWYET